MRNSLSWLGLTTRGKMVLCIHKTPADYPSMPGLSRQDTQLLKGIAICLMLWRHLFATGTSFLGFTGYLGKICVPVFLLLSGYGLTIQFQKHSADLNSTVRFELRRFLTFYINYWSLFIPAILIGSCFGRTPAVVYPADTTMGLFKWIGLDFFAVAYWNSYCWAGWFNQLILFFYFIFPLLLFLCKKFDFLFVAIATAICVWIKAVPGHPLYYPHLEEVYLHGPAFLFGIILALHPRCFFLSRHKGTKEIIAATISVFFCVFLLICCYFAALPPNDLVLQFYSLVALALIFSAIHTMGRLPLFQKVFCFLGHHSMNIFLLHTLFIPIGAKFHRIVPMPFLIVLGLSLACSLLLEAIKTHIGIYAFLKDLRMRLG